MLADGGEIGREIRRQQRHLVLVAEQIERLLAKREAVHLGLAGAPEDVGDRDAGRQQHQTLRNAFGEAASLLQ